MTGFLTRVFCFSFFEGGGGGAGGEGKKGRCTYIPGLTMLHYVWCY